MGTIGTVADWAAELSLTAPADDALPGDLSGVNLSLNRRRLAQFLTEFAADSDLRDLLLTDVMHVALGLPVSSTGNAQIYGSLMLRPFRVWEYVWLYKVLELDRGGRRVLDLGGPASHIVILAALAGNQVLSIDINPGIVATAEECRAILGLSSLDCRVADMRDLSSLEPESFDAIVSCSVLEHLSATDQERAVEQMARVLRPGGRIGLTFDYGPGAPGANPNLPPPHAPPSTASEVKRRYVRAGLTIAGNADIEDPLAGSLFRDETVLYTMGSLFLEKPPGRQVPVPRPVQRERTPLAALRIPELIPRLCRHMGRVLQAASASPEVKQLAAERLRGLIEKEAAIAQLKSELERRDAELQEKEQLIQAISAEAERNQSELEAKEAVIQAISAEAERNQRELEAKEAVIHAIHREAERRREELERAVDALPPQG